MWKIGQKLVCMDNSWMDPVLEKGGIYTFDGVDEALEGFIYLAEEHSLCDDPGPFKGQRNSFRATCFRPVDETFGEEVAEKLEKEFISQPEPALV